MVSRTVFCLCALLLAVASCKRTDTTQQAIAPASSPNVVDQESAPGKFDACDLIKKGEIEAIQGLPINDAKASDRSDGTFRLSQCFYTAAEFNQSVSLTVFQTDPDKPGKRDPKDFWRERFGRYANDGQARPEDKEKSVRDQRRQEKVERAAPPKKIDGLGDEAYWTGKLSGVLYVLKKNTFICISVGGADQEEIKLRKSKELAEKVLERL